MLSFHHLSLLYVAISSLSFVTASPGHGNVRLNHRFKDVATTSIQPRDSMTGDFTWYNAGLGACGTTNTASDYIVALNSPQWDSGAYCYAMITLTYQGKSVQAQVTDQCVGCAYGDLDLTEDLFAALSGGDPSVIGEMYGGTWSFNGASSTTTSLSTSQYTPTSTSQTPTSTSTSRPLPSTTSTSTLSLTSRSISTSASTTLTSSSSSSSASTNSTPSVTNSKVTATSGSQVFDMLQQAVIQIAVLTADVFMEK